MNLFAAAPTRVTADGMEWENGDDIGVSIYTKIIDPDQDLNYKYTYVFNLHYTISDATTGAMSPVSDDDKCTLGNQTRYYAHSPYSTDSSFFVDGDYKCDVRINQTPILSAFTDSAEGLVALEFKHQYAKLTFTFDDSSSISAVALKGAIVKDKFGVMTSKWYKYKDEIEVADLPLTIKNNIATTYIIPQDVKDKSIYLAVSVGSRTPYYYIKTEKWESGKSYKYNISVN